MNTKEYLGQAHDLAQLASQWENYLNYSLDTGITLRDIVSDKNNAGGGIAAVSNFGSDDSWAGNYMATANSFAFGRLAWNPALKAKQVLKEWVQVTWGLDQTVVQTVS